MIDNVIPLPIADGSNAGPRIMLTVEEAACRLGIGRTSMYHLVMTGAVESVRIGRLRRVPVECLGEYVARLRATGSACSGYTATAA